MNYEKIYNSLIDKRIKEKSKEDYTETHHILPKSMGGDNTISNLVVLSAREHFIAHYLLWKIYKTKEMGFALHAMRMSKGLKKLNARQYELLRLAFSKVNTGELNPMYGKCGKLHHLYGTKMSLETKQKISESQKGKKASEKTKLKLSELRQGSKHPQYNKRGYDAVSKAKEVEQLNKDGLLIQRFGSARDAARCTNTPHSNIINCCLGKKYKSAGGYIWRYYLDDSQNLVLREKK